MKMRNNNSFPTELWRSKTGKSRYTLRRRAAPIKDRAWILRQATGTNLLWGKSKTKRPENGENKDDYNMNFSFIQPDVLLALEGSDPSVKDSALNSSCEGPEISRKCSISLHDPGRLAHFEDELLKLGKRVSALEKKNNMLSKMSSKLCGTMNFEESFATKGDDGMGGIWTCIELIRSKEVALLQCIWLIICVGLFIGFGSYLFLNAHALEKAKWKSERKVRTIDYAGDDVDHQYVIPYVYLLFQLGIPEDETKDTWLSAEVIDSTVKELLASQNHFENQTGILYLSEISNIDEMHDTQSQFYPVDAVPVWLPHLVTNESFWAYFRLKLSDPDVGRQWIQFWLTINAAAFSQNGRIPIISFWVYIGRSAPSAEAGTLKDALYMHTEQAFYGNSSLSFTIDYSEKKMSRDAADLDWFEFSLAWWESKAFTPDSETNSIIELEVTTDLKVEYWEEYVEYSYYDWLAAMGGLLSIFSFIFFQVGYVIAVVVGEGYTMGILPELSFTFSNLEMVYLVRDFYFSKKFSCDLVDQFTEQGCEDF